MVSSRRIQIRVCTDDNFCPPYVKINGGGGARLSCHTQKFKGHVFTMVSHAFASRESSVEAHIAGFT